MLDNLMRIVEMGIDSDGELELDGSETLNTIFYYIQKVKDKDSGFAVTDLTEDDYKNTTDFIRFLEEEGFFIPEKAKILTTTPKTQIQFIGTVFSFLLNVAPQYFSSEPEAKDVREMYKDVSESDPIMLEFIQLQPYEVLLKFLTITDRGAV